MPTAAILIYIQNGAIACDPLLENRFPGHLFGMLSFGEQWGALNPKILNPPIQISGVTYQKGAFFGQVKKLAHSMEISMGLRTIAALNVHAAARVW